MALLIGVLLPELGHQRLAHGGRWFAIGATGVEPSMVCTAAAIIAAHLSLRRMGDLPLISARSLILPSFMLTFSAAWMILSTTRMDYGRYHLWVGLIVSVGWYLFMSIMRSRTTLPIIGLVGVNQSDLADLPGKIAWVMVDRPALDMPVDALVVDPHASLSLEWSKFLTQRVLAGVPVYHRDHIEEGLTGRVRFHRYADNNFGALLPSLLYLRFKRVIDFAVALLCLPLFAFAIGLAAIAIRLNSPGPVFFMQPRMGFRGQPFACIKLRTMRVDARGPDYTVEGDERITPPGRLLRKWRIDELPQIVNVLKGEMSWIGPRPEAMALAEKYAAHIPFYDYRHAVRPGVSGWAAVHQGNVAEVDAADEKLTYDFYYIKYFSIWLDFLIVLKTIQTVVTGVGSR